MREGGIAYGPDGEFARMYRRTDPQPVVRSGACWALVLAAGEGWRFGGSKLAADLGGRPLLGHALAAVDLAVLEGTLAGGVAVVPADAPDLYDVVAKAGLAPVTNQDPAAGLGRSLALGLQELARQERLPRPEAAVVVLGDQPLVRAQVIGRLVAAWRAGAAAVVRPRYSAAPEEPGHPVLLDRSTWELSAELSGDAGLGPLLRDHPDWVETVDVRGTNPDVDSRDDLDALRGSF